MLRRPNQGAGCLSEAQTWGCGLGRSLWGLRPMGPGPLSSLLRPTRCLGPSRAAAPSPAGSLSPICRLSASQLGSWSVGGGGAPLTHIPCAGKAGAAGSVGGASRATGLSQPLPSPALPARPPSPCCSHASGGRLRLQSHAASRRPGPRLLAALSFTEAASWESTNAAAGEPARGRQRGGRGRSGLAGTSEPCWGGRRRRRGDGRAAGRSGAAAACWAGCLHRLAAARGPSLPLADGTLRPRCQTWVPESVDTFLSGLRSPGHK